MDYDGDKSKNIKDYYKYYFTRTWKEISHIQILGISDSKIHLYNGSI